MRKLSDGVWALMVLTTLAALGCLSPVWSADQKPLVINPTTGKQEQLQTGNNLYTPGGSSLFVGAASVGSLGVATASQTNPLGIAAWGNSVSIVAGPANTTTASAVAFSYNRTSESGALICLTPTVSWRGMEYYGLSHNFYNGNTGLNVLAVSSSQVAVPATTASTSTTTGALVVTGGVGIGGTEYIGGAGSQTITGAYAAQINSRNTTGITGITFLRSDQTYGYSMHGNDAALNDFGLFRQAVGDREPVLYTVDGTEVLIGTRTDSGAFRLQVNGALRINSDTLVTTGTNFADGAAAQIGTLTNAPTAGNPTKWVPINDNGTTRYVPAW